MASRWRVGATGFGSPCGPIGIGGVGLVVADAPGAGATLLGAGFGAGIGTDCAAAVTVARQAAITPARAARLVLRISILRPEEIP